MVELKAEIKNLDRLTAAFRAAPDRVGRILQEAVNAATLSVFRSVRRGIVPWRTGTMVRTFGFKLEALRGRVFPTRAYAIFVHEGTAPHEIVPKRKLALFWEGAAHPVKRVHHPGTKPDKFMPRLLATSQREIDKIFERAGDRAARAIGGL